MKIGITGATGVLGKILCTRLKENNCRIYPFKEDIQCKEAVSAWIDNEFDIIFHLAAKVPVNIVNEKPLQAFSVNVGGTINLLEEIIKYKKKPWLFFASSAHVYKSSNKPIKESSNVQPITVYGETKWFAERICSLTAEKENIPLCCGRIFSYYHETQNKPFLYPTIIERLSQEDLSKPFNLYGANSIRDFLNAEDVVEIMYKLMKKKATGPINIASGKGLKVKDFVQRMSDVELIINKVDNKADYLVADIGKLKSIIEE